MATENTSASSTAAATSTEQTLTGCVKWFNNGLNYGFITVLSEGEYRNTDVFVHQSNIQTARDCFRTLYTGECVQFELAKSDNEKHPFHAVKVHGFNGVQLRCEAPRGTGFGRGRGGGERGRVGGRGRGRGSGRGNSRSGPRQNQQDSSDSAATTQENGSGETTTTSTTVNANESTPQTNTESTEPVVSTTAENATTPVAKGRGRGRGRKVNA